MTEKPRFIVAPGVQANELIYTSDVKHGFEPGYVYYTCPIETCARSHGVYKIPNTITANLSYDELRKRKADLIFKKCPTCRSYLILLYI
jgi:hypothetical protein